MAAASDVEQGASADSGGPVACVVNHPRLKAAANSNLPELDAALAGLVVLEHSAASAVDATWCERPRWTRVVRELRRHQAQGGSLGDVIAAGAVLEAAAIDFPRATAAEAVIAASEAAPAPQVVAVARARWLRLRLRRLGQIVIDTAGAEMPSWTSYLAGIHRELDQVAALAGDCGR
jgi:hypothetical protein